MRPKSLRILPAILMLALAILACNLPLKNRALTIPIRLNEETIRLILNRAIGVAAQSNPELTAVEIESIDFIEPNIVGVQGQIPLALGQSIVTSLKIAFSVVDDLPVTEITELNTGGLPVSDAQVDSLNQTLNAALVEQINSIEANATVKSIEVDEDVLVITVEVPLTGGD
jgi:hypothetical protein